MLLIIRDDLEGLRCLLPTGYDLSNDVLALEVHQDKELVIYQHLQAFLGKFKIISDKMSSSQNVTASSMIALFNFAIDHCEDATAKYSQIQDGNLLRETMLSVIDRAYQKMLQYYNKTGAIEMTAAYFDPRIRLEYFIRNSFIQDDIRTLETK